MVEPIRSVIAEAAVWPTAARADAVARGLAPDPVVPSLRLAQGNIDSAEVFDKGALDGNPPDDILWREYRRDPHHHLET